MASGKQVQSDKIVLGLSPRFTGIQALQLVRAGEGILVAVTLQITGAAGCTIQLFDGAGGTVPVTGVIDGTKGPITLWFYQTFANGLYITIAGAATDVNVITGGI